MAEENTPSIGGFDQLAGLITGNTESDVDPQGGRSMDDVPFVDPETVRQGEVPRKEEEEEDTTKSSEEEEVEEEVEETETTESTEEEDDDDKEKGEGDDKTSSDAEDLSDYEEDIVSFLNEKFSDSLGWNLPEEDAPKNVQEFIDFMGGLVDEASKPKYASEDIEALDDFVKNGGNLRDFYDQTVESKIDTESVDLENEFQQKQVVREHLKNQGYSDERINRFVSRYEDAGVLEDEAKDALELVKEHNEKTKETLLENQRKQAAEFEKQQQKFISDVEKTIDNTDNIAGNKLSKKEKEDLLDYVLTPDNSGLTGFQKEYNKNMSENLVKIAYFMKHGESLVDKSVKKGESKAVKNLHDKLKQNKGNKSKKAGSQSSTEASQGLSLLSSMLTNNE